MGSRAVGLGRRGDALEAERWAWREGHGEEDAERVSFGEAGRGTEGVGGEWQGGSQRGGCRGPR